MRWLLRSRPASHQHKGNVGIPVPLMFGCHYGQLLGQGPIKLFNQSIALVWVL